MNKATSVHIFTYLGLVVSEKNIPKNWLILHYGDMAYNLPLKLILSMCLIQFSQNY